MRTCFECEFLNYNYEGDYSDTTPGDGFTIECLCGKWHFSARIDFCKKDLRELLRTIENCDFFKPWKILSSKITKNNEKKERVFVK